MNWFFVIGCVLAVPALLVSFIRSARGKSHKGSTAVFFIGVMLILIALFHGVWFVLILIILVAAALLSAAVALIRSNHGAWGGVIIALLVIAAAVFGLFFGTGLGFILGGGAAGQSESTADKPVHYAAATGDCGSVPGGYPYTVKGRTGVLTADIGSIVYEHLDYTVNPGENFVENKGGVVGASYKASSAANMRLIEKIQSQNPASLFLSFKDSGLPLPKGITQTADLISPSHYCYNENGHTMLAALIAQEEAMIKAGQVKNEDAPANGVNSGMDAQGNPFVVTSVVISGNRMAVRIYFVKTGKTIWFMFRCGNPVTTGPPTGVPQRHYPPGSPKPTPSTPSTPSTPGTPTPHGCQSTSQFPDNSCKNPGQGAQLNPVIPAPIRGHSGSDGGDHTRVSSSPPGRGTSGCGPSGSVPCDTDRPSSTPAPTRSSGSPAPPQPSGGTTAPSATITATGTPPPPSV